MLVTLDVCIGAGTTDPRGAESFRSYLNRYSLRLSGGSSKRLNSTQPGGGLSLYILWLLKLANLPVQKTNSLPRGSRKMLKYLSRLLGQQQTTNDNLQKTDTYRQITRPVIVEPDLSQGYNYTEATYIRETGRNLNTRLTEHKGATRNGDVTINHIAEHYSTNLVPRVFSLSNMAAAGEKTLAHSELKRSLIGAFHSAFIRALSLVYSFQNKDGYLLRAS